jgi:hypothetical protein
MRALADLLSSLAFVREHLPETLPDKHSANLQAIELIVTKAMSIEYTQREFLSWLDGKAREVFEDSEEGFERGLMLTEMVETVQFSILAFSLEERAAVKDILRQWIATEEVVGYILPVEEPQAECLIPLIQMVLEAENMVEK